MPEEKRKLRDKHSVDNFSNSLVFHLDFSFFLSLSPVLNVWRWSERKFYFRLHLAASGNSSKRRIMNCIMKRIKTKLEK